MSEFVLRFPEQPTELLGSNVFTRKQVWVTDTVAGV